MTEGPEYADVESPFLEQLKAMGWEHIVGDIEVPAFTGRERFRDVLLVDRLTDAIKRINRDEDGKPWLDKDSICVATNALSRLDAASLLEANQAATQLLLEGIRVQGPDGKLKTVRYIDFDKPENNDFLVINQFRVDPLWAPEGRGFIIPDIVLFVNGVPVVVVECKGRASRAPIETAITQLRRYANQRDEVKEPEGAEQLFYTNQFTIPTSYDKAYAGTFTASAKYYVEWKDTYPLNAEELQRALGVSELSRQHQLVAGMLSKAHLLDIIRNFTVFLEVSGRMAKIVCRYQQFRAVYKTIERLETGKTRTQTGEMDQRGGVVWHTQGSGKSLTMVFLIRKMRSMPELRRFKLVVVTDRIDLEEQLKETARLTGDPVQIAHSVEDLKGLLSQPGAALVFGMIQKFRGDDGEDAREEAIGPFGVLNRSEDILVVVDEAHRSHTKQLHATLMAALPNCAKIGFTGTPILKTDKKRTAEIFGEFLDTYSIEQSQQDGSTVPILYEGHPVFAAVESAEDMDALFEIHFAGYTPEELEAIKQRHATKSKVLEAQDLIEKKAADMLYHYVSTALPNGYKAQVVSVSRVAAVRYQAALVKARDELVQTLQMEAPRLMGLAEHELEEADEDTRFLVRAHSFLEIIRHLEFSAVISGAQNDDPAWRRWTDRGGQASHIKRFKKALHQDPLCMLVVKSMLLTGFDAPVNQVLYLDRSMREHELLQAIARVNRPYPRKSHGLVVDYYGVAHHLYEALQIYSLEDIKGAWVSIKDELPRLVQRRQHVLSFFTEQGCEINDTDACVLLLKDERHRARFKALLSLFLESLETILPRPEALPFIRDAKRLGYIRKVAMNRYRDDQLSVADAGGKVRALIDEYVRAQGIDPGAPPIDILDADFADCVAHQRGKETQAAEMEHAVRYHIRRRLEEDPVYYRKLSERLDAILEEFKDKWDVQVEELGRLIDKIRAGRPSDDTGLDPQRQAPFFSLLVDALGEESVDIPRRLELARHIATVVDHIRDEILRVDFWRNPNARDELKSWIFRYMDEHGLLPFEKLEDMSDEMIRLARQLHTRLTS